MNTVINHPNTHFLNLEKARAANKTINKLRKDNGLSITDPKEILEEQARFYEKLYTSSLSNIDELLADIEQVIEELEKLLKPKHKAENHEPLTQDISEADMWKIISTLNRWRNRNLSLAGSIGVLTLS